MALPLLLSQASDEKLVDWYLQSRDEHTFAILYERYYTPVYNQCSFILRYHTLQPEDAAQEVLIKVYNNLHKYNRSAKFSTWLFSITRHYCIDRLRQKSRQPSLTSIEEDGCQELQDDYQDPFVNEEAFTQERIQRLHTVLDEDLRHTEAEILRMKYREGLTARDIGVLIDKTESAVKMRIKRAKRKAVSKYSARFRN